MIALNVGCGPRIFQGPWVNADIIPDLPGCRRMDIEKPWPWPDSFYDQVWANHIAEHGTDRWHFISELWRVSKPGAFVQIRVPIHTWDKFWDDPTHKSHWTMNTLDAVTQGHPGHTALGMKHVEFTVVHHELRDGWEIAWDLIVVKPGQPDTAEEPIKVPQEGALHEHDNKR